MFQIQGHLPGEFQIVIAAKAGIRRVDENHLFAVEPEGFGQFHPNIPRAHHGHGANVAGLQLFHHLLGVLVAFDQLHVLQVPPRDGGNHRQTAGG